MSDDGERVSIEIVRISLDEEERLARRFPELDFERVATSPWVRVKTDFGVGLRLPHGFAEADEPLPGQAFWVAEDGAMFLLTRHEGGGNVSTLIQPDAERASYEHEGLFRTEMAGRTVRIQLSRIRLEEQEYFLASADGGITPGFGIGVAILALRAEQRDLLLNALGTIRWTQQPT